MVLVRAAALAGAAFALGWWASAQRRRWGAGAGGGAGGAPALPDPADVLALIKARRSIFPKDYVAVEQAAPTRAQLEAMLEASNWAPTHGKTEPWRFVVLEQGSIQKFFGVCRCAARARRAPRLPPRTHAPPPCGRPDWGCARGRAGGRGYSDAMKEKFGATSDKFLAYQGKQEKSRKDKAKCSCECGHRAERSA